MLRNYIKNVKNNAAKWKDVLAVSWSSLWFLAKHWNWYFQHDKCWVLTIKTNKEDLTCIAWYMQNWTLDANLIWTDIKNEISEKSTVKLWSNLVVSTAVTEIMTKKMTMLEQNLGINVQYSRYECLEISGLLSSTKDELLFWKFLRKWMELRTILI